MTRMGWVRMSGPIHVTVTFMACSSAGLCFQPIIAEPLEVALT